MTDILSALFALQDYNYKSFNAKLIPNVSSERIIGIRIPDLRRLAKTIKTERKEEAEKFISSLPHYYLEENNLHAYIVALSKDFNECIRNVEKFIPYIDNWCTCDTFNPKIFARHKKELLEYIFRWLTSDKPYTVRFALCCLMNYFLDDKDFKAEYLETVSRINCEDYYVITGVAWFFATALSKQWDATLPYIKKGKLDYRTHNKTITKAVESFRISLEHKQELKQYRLAGWQ